MSAQQTSKWSTNFKYAEFKETHTYKHHNQTVKPGRKF